MPAQTLEMVYNNPTYSHTYMADIHNKIIAHPSWQFIETVGGFNSGNWTWNIYKNAAAGNSYGWDWYIAIASPTAAAAQSNLYFMVFEEWDTATKMFRKPVAGNASTVIPQADFSVLGTWTALPTVGAQPTLAMGWPTQYLVPTSATGFTGFLYVGKDSIWFPTRVSTTDYFSGAGLGQHTTPWGAANPTVPLIYATAKSSNLAYVGNSGNSAITRFTRVLRRTAAHSENWRGFVVPAFGTVSTSSTYSALHQFDYNDYLHEDKRYGAEVLLLGGGYASPTVYSQTHGYFYGTLPYLVCYPQARINSSIRVGDTVTFGLKVYMYLGTHSNDFNPSNALSQYWVNITDG